jgi:GMP synthase-like glutamine amidotransferase
MKILLINNNTQHLAYLQKALANHEVEVQVYKPGLEFNYHDKDLVILSGGGGEGLEIHDYHTPGKLWYDDEMNFVRTCQKPILGICMGFEVISRAFGATVQKLQKGLDGFAPVQATDLGKKLFGKSKLKQYEAHDWGVPNAPSGFDVLAKSPTGIEIIKHQNRPIFATQFHPEKGGTLKLEQIIAANLV